MTILVGALIVTAIISGTYFWGSVLRDLWRWWHHEQPWPR